MDTTLIMVLVGIIGCVFVKLDMDRRKNPEYHYEIQKKRDLSWTHKLQRAASIGYALTTIATILCGLFLIFGEKMLLIGLLCIITGITIVPATWFFLGTVSEISISLYELRNEDDDEDE